MEWVWIVQLETLCVVSLQYDVFLPSIPTNNNKKLNFINLSTDNNIDFVLYTFLNFQIAEKNHITLEQREFRGFFTIANKII